MPARIARVMVPLTLSLLCAGAAGAQERIVRPGGEIATEYHARRCDSHKIEMIDVRPTGLAALPHDFLDRASKAIFFYFSPLAAKPPRLAIARVELQRDGSLSPAQLQLHSGDTAFDAALVQALVETSRAGVLTIPGDIPQQSLTLDVAAGRRAGSTKPYLKKRTVCPVWPKADNPLPDYPPEQRDHGIRGIVRAQFIVTVDGRVRPESFQVIASSDPAFTEAVRDILPDLRYQPAEVMGKKVEQLTEQTFTFGFTDRPVAY